LLMLLVVGCVSVVGDVCWCVVDVYMVWWWHVC
jgi:hypothetical protein